MRLSVRGERVFIRPDKQPERSESGLHLVYERQQSTMRGTVIALGAGPVTGKGARLPHLVNVGDRVVFAAESGEECQFERETLICMKEDQILAVIEPS